MPLSSKTFSIYTNIGNSGHTSDIALWAGLPYAWVVLSTQLDSPERDYPSFLIGYVYFKCIWTNGGPLIVQELSPSAPLLLGDINLSPSLDYRT